MAFLRFWGVVGGYSRRARALLSVCGESQNPVNHTSGAYCADKDLPSPVQVLGGTELSLR